MSNWSNLIGTLNAACIVEFSVPATFTPQDGSGAQAIAGIVRSPAILEDYPAGFGPGTTNVRFWVQFSSITPSPKHGDQVTLNGLTYTVGEVEAEVDGSATLKLVLN